MNSYDSSDALGLIPLGGGEPTNPLDVTHTRIKEQKDILWAMYQDSILLARSQEAQRVKVSNIILLTSVAVVGVVAHGGLTISDWPLTGALIPLGVYGAFFTSTCFESICRYQKRARKHYQAFASLVSTGEPRQSLEEIISVDDCEHDEALPNFGRLSWLSLLRTLWPLMISLMGLAATVYLFLRWLTTDDVQLLPILIAGPCMPG
ncbi:MAG TPA: hypothetical protein VJ866_19875 [Pyrinomonadaceae bacterium]|nr:hypothetical protein [Pyrinomonadaceae bacterium]